MILNFLYVYKKVHQLFRKNENYSTIILNLHIDITNSEKHVLKEKLLSTTEYLTLLTRCRIKRYRYNRVRES